MLIFLHAFFPVSLLFPFWQVHLPFYLFLSSCISFLRISLLLFTFFPFILHVYLFINLFLIVYIYFFFSASSSFRFFICCLWIRLSRFALPYFNLMFFSFYSFLSFRFSPSFPFSRFSLRFPFFFYLLSIFSLPFPRFPLFFIPVHSPISPFHCPLSPVSIISAFSSLFPLSFFSFLFVWLLPPTLRVVIAIWTRLLAGGSRANKQFQVTHLPSE